jgi:hypothetical protein
MTMKLIDLQGIARRHAAFKIERKYSIARCPLTEVLQLLAMIVRQEHEICRYLAYFLASRAGLGGVDFG